MEQGSDRPGGRWTAWLAPYVHLSSNPLSLIGVVLVTTAVILWLFLLPSMMRAGFDNPYHNILTMAILPALFFLGLLAIPLGAYLRKRRERQLGVSAPSARPLTLNSPDLRRLLAFFAIATVFNVLIGGQLIYRGTHYMDSVQFCGTACHSVMKPEYTAYGRSAHARVECVKCHIGPGASWAVRSKIDGLRQVWAVAFNTYERPIPVPVETLRPARDTCEACHWPQKFGTDRVRVIDKYADDEQNTHTRTVLLLKIGGGLTGERARAGIHGAHLGPGIEIRYGHTDKQRQNIARVEYESKAAGVKRIYTNDDSTQKVEMRLMDCMDCHNRPSHSFELPERALDAALSHSQVDASLPFARRQGLAVLKTAYTSEAEASARIPQTFEEFYQSRYPELYRSKRDSIVKSAQSLLEIYRSNVFPEMRITWGTYPNNIGHTDFPGCFRCHDEAHKTSDGARTIKQDCSSCHELLAMEEPDPKILKELGLIPQS